MVMRIRELRLKADLGQAALAANMGVMQCTVSQWEHEITLPPTRALPRLASVLNCSINELFYAQENQEN